MPEPRGPRVGAQPAPGSGSYAGATGLGTGTRPPGSARGLSSLLPRQISQCRGQEMLGWPRWRVGSSARKLLGKSATSAVSGLSRRTGMGSPAWHSGERGTGTGTGTATLCVPAPARVPQHPNRAPEHGQGSGPPTGCHGITLSLGDAARSPPGTNSSVRKWPSPSCSFLG